MGMNSAPQESENLNTLIEELETAPDMEARLGIELRIIDTYIASRKPKEDIISALEELKISAIQENFPGLAEQIENKIETLNMPE